MYCYDDIFKLTGMMSIHLKPYMVFFYCFFAFWSYAQHNNTESGLALKGYDPVAYHTENTARQGKREITAEHRGVAYFFSSLKNRDFFLENPEKYVPLYGGWCAYAMSRGEKVKINPEAFLISDEKLFLFYKTIWVDTREKWLKNSNELEENASKNWALINSTARVE